MRKLMKRNEQNKVMKEKIIKNKCYVDGKYLDTIIMGILRNEMIE